MVSSAIRRKPSQGTHDSWEKKLIHIIQRSLLSGFLGRETANRKLQFAVKSWQFHIDGIPNFSKAFVVKCVQVIFGQVEVLHFYRLKNIKNIFSRVQKTHLHITGGCRNLSLALKTLT